MRATGIEWTEATWNPVTGCDQVSPGCDNCYALILAARLKAMGSPKYQHDGDPRTSGPGFGVAVHPDVFTQPLRWRTPRRVFVNSMSDLGHARIPRTAQARIWATMALTRRHQFQILTKRPRRLARLLTADGLVDEVAREATAVMVSRAWQRWQLEVRGWSTTPHDGGNVWCPPWPLPNVWVGTSIETDDYCYRADQLREIPTAVRFLSLEPLLGPQPSLDLTGIDWVIVGGESGPRHRPLDLGWVRDIRDRCRAAGIAFFFKQVGGRTPRAGGRLLDGRTWNEYPTGVAT